MHLTIKSFYKTNSNAIKLFTIKCKANIVLRKIIERIKKNAAE